MIDAKKGMHALHFQSDLADIQGSSRTGMYGNTIPVLFIQWAHRSRCFFCILQLLTVIFHGSPSVIKLIRLPLAESNFSEKELNLLK